MPSLDLIRFNSDGYTRDEARRPGQVRVWFTPDGDGVGLYMFGVPPDLPRVETADELWAFYARRLEPSGGKLVENALVTVSDCRAIRIIVKTPQEPSGMLYVGSITIPFRDFSFVLKVQCGEHGMTGLREDVLLDRRFRDGQLPTVQKGRLDLAGWDPDNEDHDAEFPQHPVSRVRRALEGICRSLTIDPKVATAAPLPLPLPNRE